MQRERSSSTFWLYAAAALSFISSAWAAEYTAIYKFRVVDGHNPAAALIFDAAGNLYGTTVNGGYYGGGTVFMLTPTPSGRWTETVIHGFGGADGIYPYGALTFDAAGNLYGTTVRGGPGISWGTAFKLSPNPDGSWTQSVIYAFEGDKGSDPYAGLIFDTAGNLYGTAILEGGFNCWGSGCGAVFKLTPGPDQTWTASVVHGFDNNGLDGYSPHAGLIMDGNGNLYGTTTFGGTYDRGTVFKLMPQPDGAWAEIVLYNFAGSDGSIPVAALFLDTAGNLYGSTSTGGTYDAGTIFRLTPNPDGSWQHTTLHVFKGRDGASPYAGLISDVYGNLYGTTRNGGVYNSGTVFKLEPEPGGYWNLTKLHTFKHGQHPYAGLVMDNAGNLYGTAPGGGYGYGVVFRITP